MSRQDPVVTGLAVSATATSAVAEGMDHGIGLFFICTVLYLKMLFKGDYVAKAIAILGMTSPWWAWWIAKRANYWDIGDEVIFTCVTVLGFPFLAALIDFVRNRMKAKRAEAELQTESFDSSDVTE